MGEYLTIEKTALHKRTGKSKNQHYKQDYLPYLSSTLSGNQAALYRSCSQLLMPVIQRRLKVPLEITEDTITDEFIRQELDVPEDRVEYYKNAIIGLIRNDSDHTFSSWNDTKNYIDSIDQHIDKMKTIAHSSKYTYNKAPANSYFTSSKQDAALFPKEVSTSKVKLNCWSAILFAAIGINGKDMKHMKQYAKQKDVPDGDGGSDPILKLMEQASKIDLNSLATDELKEAEMKKIPKGYIVALDDPHGRQRNSHVFLCIGDGRAIEYDESDKGECRILDISKRAGYVSCTDLWYTKPPWLN